MSKSGHKELFYVRAFAKTYIKSYVKNCININPAYMDIKLPPATLQVILRCRLSAFTNIPTEAVDSD